MCAIDSDETELDADFTVPHTRTDTGSKAADLADPDTYSRQNIRGGAVVDADSPPSPVSNERRTLRTRGNTDVPLKQGKPAYKAWSDPSNKKEWNIMKVLYTDSCLAEDNLIRPPPPNHSYLKPRKFEPEEKVRHHPKLASLIMNGTDTWQHRVYYAGGPRAIIPPIAGKIRDKPDSRDIHDHWETEARGRQGSAPSELPSSSGDSDTDSEQMGIAEPTVVSAVAQLANDSEVRGRSRTKRFARKSEFTEDEKKDIRTKLTRGAGRKFPRKTLNQARDSRPYQGDAGRRLGERNQEPPARSYPQRAPR